MYLAAGVRYIYFLLAILMAGLIINSSFQFFEPNLSNGFLAGKKEVFYKGYNWALYTHILSAPLSIFLGVLQFTLKKGKVHRLFGKIYLAVVVLFAAPSGFVMAFFAIGGFWSILGFSILSVLWFWFTYRAFLLVKKSQYILHQEFMTRSFIMANSAIALRLMSFVNIRFLHFPVEEAYILIAWLSWVPFLLVFEISLKIRSQKVS